MKITNEQILKALSDLNAIVAFSSDDTCMCGAPNSKFGCDGHSFTPSLQYRYCEWRDKNSELLTAIEDLQVTTQGRSNITSKTMSDINKTIFITPHDQRELVNNLKNIAVEYKDCRSLREVISRTISDFILTNSR